MIIYKVHSVGIIHTFCRSYESARDVIRKYDPKARVIGHLPGDDLWVFKNWRIQRIDIKPDKAGICEALNKAVNSPAPSDEDPDEEYESPDEEGYSSLPEIEGKVVSPYEPYSVHSDNWSPEHKLRCF